MTLEGALNIIAGLKQLIHGQDTEILRLRLLCKQYGIDPNRRWPPDWAGDDDG